MNLENSKTSNPHRLVHNLRVIKEKKKKQCTCGTVNLYYLF